MTHASQAQSAERLSVPRKFAAPRPLREEELRTLRAVADALIPAAGGNPPATGEPDYDEYLRRAVDARADAFGAITEVLAAFAVEDPPGIDRKLRSLHAEEPDTFQALSAVVAGAWLLIPQVRERIGYPGQRRDPARLEEAADQLSDGILDPVMERGPIYRPTPAR